MEELTKKLPGHLVRGVTNPADSEDGLTSGNIVLEPAPDTESIARIISPICYTNGLEIFSSLLY